MFAWGGQWVLCVGVKRLGRHQVSVHLAWCSALCTAGLSRCCCRSVCSLEAGKGRGWRKGNPCRKPSGSADKERGRVRGWGENVE